MQAQAVLQQQPKRVLRESHEHIYLQARSNGQAAVPLGCVLRYVLFVCRLDEAGPSIVAAAGCIAFGRTGLHACKLYFQAAAAAAAECVLRVRLLGFGPRCNSQAHAPYVGLYTKAQTSLDWCPLILFRFGHIDLMCLKR